MKKYYVVITETGIFGTLTLHCDTMERAEENCNSAKKSGLNSRIEIKEY